MLLDLSKTISERQCETGASPLRPKPSELKNVLPSLNTSGPNLGEGMSSSVVPEAHSPSLPQEMHQQDGAAADLPSVIEPSNAQPQIPDEKKRKKMEKNALRRLRKQQLAEAVNQSPKEANKDAHAPVQEAREGFTVPEANRIPDFAANGVDQPSTSLAAQVVQFGSPTSPLSATINSGPGELLASIQTRFTAENVWCNILI